MSPKIIPKATNKPSGETLLVIEDINATRSRFQMTGLVCVTCKSNKGKTKHLFGILNYSSSTILFNFTIETGATISGNFSTVTVERSSPKPFSSDKLISLSQK